MNRRIPERYKMEILERILPHLPGLKSLICLLPLFLQVGKNTDIFGAVPSSLTPALLLWLYITLLPARLQLLPTPILVQLHIHAGTGANTARGLAHTSFCPSLVVSLSPLEPRSMCWNGAWGRLNNRLE